MTLNFGQIRHLTTEFAALECLKTQCPHFLSGANEPILSKLADDEKMHNILDELEFRADWTTDNRVSC